MADSIFGRSRFRGLPAASGDVLAKAPPPLGVRFKHRLDVSDKRLSYYFGFGFPVISRYESGEASLQLVAQVQRET
jgi:hypothetical protein